MVVRIALILGILLPTAVSADENDAAKKAQAARAAAQKRLEEARIRLEAAQAQRAVQLAQLGFRGANYEVAEKVDRDDPMVRFLLLLPGNPLLVEAAIAIDGKPFREPREKLIDEMLAIADADKDDKPTWEEAIKNPRFFFGQVLRFGNDQQRAAYLKGLDRDGDGLVSRYEARLMLAQRSQGPAFMLSATSSSGNRSGRIFVSPDGRVVSQGGSADLRELLDTDGDGDLSAEEIAATPDELKKRDANDNDLLESTELQEGTAARGGGSNAGGGFAGRPAPSTQRLYVMLGPTAKVEDLYNVLRRDARGIPRKLLADGFRGMSAELFNKLDANQDGEVQPDELLGLNHVEPQVRLKVGLGKTSRGMEVKALVDAVRETTPRGEHVGGIGLPGVNLSFSVPEQAGSRGYDYSATAKAYVARYDRNKNGYIEKEEMAGRLATQFLTFDENSDGKVYADEIAKSYERQLAPTMSQIRATVVMQDGVLFSALDGSGDNRLSLREMRESAKRLKAFDKNGDGKITKEEISINIDVTFNLGTQSFYRQPTVSRRTGAARPVPPQARGPQWFVRMDRNGDGDVTLREFLGTPEQFQRIDTNGDSFIEPKEAEAVKDS